MYTCICTYIHIHIHISETDCMQIMTQMTIGGGRPIEEHLFSRFLVIDLPAADKIAEDPTTLRIREGPTLNSGIMAFGSVIKALAQMRDVTDSDFLDFGQSKVRCCALFIYVY